MPTFASVRKNLKDGINFLSKATPKRVWNALSVYTSFYLSSWTKKPIQWGIPISISVEPTTSCNLRCPECPSGLRSFTRPTGMLDRKTLDTMLHQVGDTIWYLLLYFQGEPYLHKQFLEMVSLASKRGIYVATSTNAHYLTDDMAKRTVESGLDRMIISIDGTSQDTYQQYRVGGQLDKVLEGAKRIVKWKKELKSATPYVVFQFLVVKPNEHQIEEVKALAKEIGVDDIAFKTAQVYEYENGNELIPTIDKYSRYRKDSNGKFKIKNKLVNQCWKLWHSSVLTWDGTVVPCCFDKDAEHPMGKIEEGNTFQDVWEGSSYKDFRREILKSRKNIGICTNCTEGTKVWSE